MFILLSLIILSLFSQGFAQSSQQDSLDVEIDTVPRGVTALVSQQYTQRDPIRITNDNDFEILGFPGEGTENNPYLIENYMIEITATSGYDWGIEVRGTESHFIMRNCFIKGNETSQRTEGVGVFLYDTSNGQIKANRFEDLALSMSIQSELVNYIIEDNHFIGEDNNEFRTTIGISIDGPNQNLILINNIFDSCTIAVQVTKSEVQIVNNTLDNNMEGLFIHLSSRVVITGNTISNGAIGFGLGNVNNSLVSCNSISQCIMGGTLGGNNNLITNNTFALCQENTDFPAYPSYGLHIYPSSGNNSIIWNDFIDNQVNAKNDAEGTTFDFNHYSDYTGVDENADGIGDTPYKIGGDEPIQDNHPRMLQANHTTPIDLVVPLLLAAITGCTALFCYKIRKKEG